MLRSNYITIALTNASLARDASRGIETLNNTYPINGVLRDEGELKDPVETLNSCILLRNCPRSRASFTKNALLWFAANG